MAKDSYWFRHDSTAGRGVKMRKMAFIYGHWGKGIYWDVIEILRDQSNYSYPSSEFDLRMLSDLIGCKDDAKFINWFNDCVKFELFIVENDAFFCPPLSESMGVWETKKGNGLKGGRPPIEKPDNNLNDKLIESETKPKRKANRNHNRTEQNNTEQDITEQNRTIQIPPFENFKDYALTKKPKVCLEALKRKYDVWVESDWYDGNGNKILNWKTKLINTLPFIEEARVVYKNPAAGTI